MITALEFLLTPFLVAWLSLAAWVDWRSHRIPNALTISGLACALAIRLAAGIDPVIAGLLGAALGVGLGLVAFFFGVFGGGDAKLLVMAGAFLGPATFLRSLLPIALVGGVLAIVAVARRGTLKPVLFNLRGLVRRWVPIGPPSPVLPATGDTGLPYGVAIAIGTLGWWFASLGQP